MPLPRYLMPVISQLVTSRRLRLLRHRLFEMKRRLSGELPTAQFWFRADDPYSWLLAQQLPDLSRRFNLRIEPKVVQQLPADMYPEPELFRAWALSDAPRCATVHGLTFPAGATAPSRRHANTVNRILLAHEQEPGFLSLAQTLCRKLWQGDPDEIFSLATQMPIMDEAQANALLAQRCDELAASGHYMSGTLHYGGEWYWGPDRLDHLAERLARLNGNTDDANHGRAWRALRLQPFSAARGMKLELFFSFRSPYSYLALDRVYRLARHYRLDLKIRPVLPMVMRGLPVPPSKRLYLLRDAAREAERAHVPFGRIVDPLGKGVENCMALWPFAERYDLLPDFIFNAATAIWSEGRDMSNPRHLRKVVEQTGLTWKTAQQWLAKEAWRQAAEANRREMLAAGNWGVPSLRFDNEMLWGQDRITLLEKRILSVAS